MSLATEFSLGVDLGFVPRVQAALLNYCLQTVFLEVTNDVQTVTVTGAPTGGSFTLANGPLTSAQAPAWNVTAQALQALLQAGLPIGASCVCTGGPLPGTAVVVTWTGNLANAPQNAMTVTANNLTGGSSPNASVAHTTTGVAAVNHSQRSALASVILGSPALHSPSSYAINFAAAVATDATVQADYTGGGNLQTAVTDAHIATALAAMFNAFM